MEVQFALSNAPTPAKFADARFLGIFSRLDFLERFPDTPTNKNRARSSAVHKAWLCRSLSPAAVFEDARLSGFLDPEHAGKKECASCHLKLDPLAKAFTNWPPLDANAQQPMFDSSVTAAFALVKNQQTMSFGSGLPELGAVMQGDTEVMQCVVQNAWKFTHGAEAEISPKWLQEETIKFSQDQNFWRLVGSAVSHPAFLNPVLKTLKYSSVQPLLEVCSSCHGNGTAPEFNVASYPFRANTNENAALLKRMVRTLRDEGSMPPAPLPAVEDVPLFLKWIAEGARTTEGQVSVTSEQINEVLKDEK